MFSNGVDDSNVIWPPYLAPCEDGSWDSTVISMLWISCIFLWTLNLLRFWKVLQSQYKTLMNISSWIPFWLNSRSKCHQTVSTPKFISEQDQHISVFFTWMWQQHGCKDTLLMQNVHLQTHWERFLLIYFL